MKRTIFLKTFSPPPISKKEILHYAQGKETQELNLKIDKLLNECESLINYKICYCKFPISFSNDAIDLGFTKCYSKDLAKNLSGCQEIILFAATLGHSYERVLSKYIRLSPADALILQAIGTERIEALANAFEEELKNSFAENGITLRPRFSPGYGDLPLSLQTDIFNTLDCPKNLGIHLTPQLLMIPSKSITAIIGLKENK